MFRWLSLLFCQEFQLPDVIRVWDSVLAKDDAQHSILLHFATAMIIMQRNHLLVSDFASNMQLLQVTISVFLKEKHVLFKKKKHVFFFLKRKTLLKKKQGSKCFFFFQTLVTMHTTSLREISPLIYSIPGIVCVLGGVLLCLIMAIALFPVIFPRKWDVLRPTGHETSHHYFFKYFSNFSC